MRIQIKLKGNADPPKYSYHSRILSVKCSSSKGFQTPNRAVTNYELNSRAFLGRRQFLNSDIGVSFKPINQKNMLDILDKGKSLNRISREFGSSFKMMNYFNYSFAVPQPGDSTLKLLKSKRLIPRFTLLNPLIQFQEDVKVNALSLPWLNLSPQEFKKYHRESLDTSDDQYDVIPIIDPACEKLTPYLNYLNTYKETGEVNVIGVIGRSYDTHISQYNNIWHAFKDKDVLITVLNIDRAVSHIDTSLSPVHKGEFVVGDVFASKVPTGGSFDPSSKPINNQILFFDKDSLCVSTIEYLKKHDNWKTKIINELEDNESELILNNYTEAEGDKDKTNILRRLSRVHEFKQSRQELIDSQKFIAQDDIKSYMDNKPELKKAFSSSYQSILET